MHAIYERNTLLAPLDRQGDGADLGEMPVWNLDDLYPGPESPELEQDLAWLDEAASGFADEYANRLGELDADGLLGAIEAYQDIQIVVGRIGSFAGLRFAQNMGDPGRAKFQADMQDALTKATTHLVFVSLEVNRIPDAELEAKLMANPALARYRPLFRRLRAMRPHQLSDELEQFLHDQSVVGSTAWVRLFDETVATMKFNVDGADLGLEATLNFLSDTDRSKREAAARAIATGFKPQMPLFTRITNTLAKTKEIEDRWRRFEIPEASRHLSNDVEPAIVDALRDAVVAAYPDLSHRYYALKARWMGLDKLEVWDRNAPLPEQSDETIDWQEAKRIVVDAYRGFDPRLADLLLPFFEKGWIDAPVSEGKAPGAFAHPTVSSVHPYVLLNYLGKTRDVMTLAHELGHGVHQVLAADQGELLSSTPLTLAETASVFGEMLTFRSLLDRAGSVRERRVLLAGKVEDMINTVVRQIAFYDFESKLHAARRSGELTTNDIDAIWMGVQRDSLGPSFNFMEGYEAFWAYIPHFIHSPFYVYAYAFGDGLVNALYAEFESGHDGFREKYIELLRAGGSLHHSELLAPFGLDAADPTFWSRGLGVISTFIDELEEIADP